MTLTLSIPPGRRSRKALAHAGEIQRLSALGYSLETIREALLSAGVVVSKSTVQREASRLPRVARSAITNTSVQAPPAGPVQLGSPAPVHVPPSASPFPAAPQSGRQLAEDFVRGRITNPLIRTKGRP